MLASFLFPIIVSFYTGMLDWNGIGEKKFVGFDNFNRLCSMIPYSGPPYEGRCSTRSLRWWKSRCAYSWPSYLTVTCAKVISSFRSILRRSFCRSLSSVNCGKQSTIPYPWAACSITCLVTLGLDSWTHNWLTDPKSPCTAFTSFRCGNISGIIC